MKKAQTVITAVLILFTASAFVNCGCLYALADDAAQSMARESSHCHGNQAEPEKEPLRHTGDCCDGLLTGVFDAGQRTGKVQQTAWTFSAPAVVLLPGVPAENLLPDILQPRGEPAPAVTPPYPRHLFLQVFLI